MHNAFSPHDDLAAMKAGLQRFQEQLLDLLQQAGQMSETVSKMIGEDAYQEEPSPDYGTPDMEEDNTFGLTPEELAELAAILADDEDDGSPTLGAESLIRFASDGHTSPGVNMDSESKSYIDDPATTAPNTTANEQDTLPEDDSTYQGEPAPDHSRSELERFYYPLSITPEQMAEYRALFESDDVDSSPSLEAESVIRDASDGHTSPGVNSDSKSYASDLTTTAPTSIPTNVQDTLPEDNTACQEEHALDHGAPEMEDDTFGLTPEQLAEIDAILNADEGDESPSLGAESVIHVASDGHTSMGAKMDSDSASYIDYGPRPEEEANPDDDDSDAYGRFYGEVLPTLIEKHELIERKFTLYDSQRSWSIYERHKLIESQLPTQEENRRLLNQSYAGKTPRESSQVLSRAMDSRATLEPKVTSSMQSPLKADLSGQQLVVRSDVQ
jgi:hypothetical protein